MKYLPALLALFFVAAPLQAQPEIFPIQTSDPSIQAAQSGTLKAKQASELEAALEKYPEDLTARTKLLGYYFCEWPTISNAKELRRKHILWIIKNRPEAEIADTPYCLINENLDNQGYREGKLLWADQLRAHPQDCIIIGHAARFLTLADRTLAAELLKRAKKLEPTNPNWPDQLGHLYAIQDRKETAASALEEFEKAQALDTSEKSKVIRLSHLAKSAFTAGEIEKARYYAEQVLQVGNEHPDDWEYRTSIHQANIVLGRIALKQKKIKLADEYLLKAGQTPGSPALNSFGPNMSLANELLKAGQKKTVLQYFELCRKFWTGLDGELDLWTKQVKAGKTPQFGSNLYY
jgi:hypothetical protein